MRSDDAMTEEGGLNRPPLSTLSVPFPVPKPPQENFSESYSSCEPGKAYPS